MIVDVSYTDKKNTETIDEMLGQSFGFMQRIKMGGIGSPKLSLTDADDRVGHLMNQDINRNVCNIEMRPKGIIVGFRRGLDPFALLMSYRDLEIISIDADNYTLKSKEHFISFKVRKRDKSTHHFIEKLREAQREFLGDYS